jgi:hypothetical protein
MADAFTATSTIEVPMRQLPTLITSVNSLAINYNAFFNKSQFMKIEFEDGKILYH